MRNLLDASKPLLCYTGLPAYVQRQYFRSQSSFVTPEDIEPGTIILHKPSILGEADDRNLSIENFKVGRVDEYLGGKGPYLKPYFQIDSETGPIEVQFRDIFTMHQKATFAWLCYMNVIANFPTLSESFPLWSVNPSSEHGFMFSYGIHGDTWAECGYRGEYLEFQVEESTHFHWDLMLSHIEFELHEKAHKPFTKADWGADQ